MITMTQKSTGQTWTSGGNAPAPKQPEPKKETTPSANTQAAEQNVWKSPSGSITMTRRQPTVTAAQPTPTQPVKTDGLLTAILASAPQQPAQQQNKATTSGSFGDEKPTLGERIKNIFTGAAKQTAGGYADTLGYVGELFNKSSENTNDAEGYAERLERSNENLAKYRQELAALNEWDANYWTVKHLIENEEANVREFEAALGGLNAGAEIRDEAQRFTESGAQDVSRAKQGLGKAGSLLVDVGVAGTQLAGDAALGIVAPGGSLAAMGVRSFGGAAQEARKQGATLGQQAAYGAAVAGVEMLTEKMFDGLAGVYGKGGADEIVQRAIDKLAKSAAGRKVLEVLAGAGGEAAEEAVSGIVGPALQSIYDGEKIGVHYSKDTITDILHDAAVGALLGGGMTAIGGGAQSTAENITPETPAQAQEAQNTAPNAVGARIAPQTATDTTADQTPVQTQINASESVMQNAEETAQNEAAEEAPQQTVGVGVGAAEAGFSPFSHAEFEYGVQDGGENAVRPDDAPVSTNGKDRVSRTVVTAKGAAVTPEDFVPLIENETMKGGFSFIPITNNETVQDAENGIIELGWDDALTKWRADVNAGKASAKITATGALLYNNAVNSGDTKLALDILSDYAAGTRNAAQALQAARILKTLAPENRLYMIRKGLAQFADDMKIPDGIEIPAEIEQAYVDAKTDEDANAAIDRMIEAVAAQIPSTATDKWNALRYVNMLGNFKTQTRNVAGNVGMGAVSRIRYAVAAALEGVANKLSGGRLEKTKAFAPGRDRINAAKADFSNVQRIALGEGKYAERRGSQADEILRRAEDEKTVFKYSDNALTNALGIAGKQGPVFKTLEAYRKATNWAMEKGDVIFSRASYSHALAGWMKAKGITAEQWNSAEWQGMNGAKVDEGRAYAINEAQQDTFRDNNKFSESISQIARGKNTWKPLKIAAEGLLPFRKTPANVLVRAEEYSPLGIINTAVTAAKAASGDATGADVINQLSKTLTGTGLFALGVILARNGLLRGGGDDDEKQQAFDELVGRQDYSLELPDGTSYTMDWITPGSIPLFMGAELAKAMEDGDLTFSDIEGALTRISEPMLQMSMLQGVNDVIDSLKYSKDNLGQLAISLGIDYLTQALTNSLVGQAERISETERMSTFAGSESWLPTFVQRKIGKASAKTPGWDYQQYPYIDQWGQKEDSGSLGRRAFENLISPGYLSKVEMTPLEKELQRLADKTGSTTVFPGYADKSFDVKGETVRLNQYQYERYATKKGQMSEKIATGITKSAAYKQMDDEQKADAIKLAYEYANAKAKQSVSKYQPGDTSWLNKAFASSKDPADYIADYVLYGSEYAGADYGKLEKYNVSIADIAEIDVKGNGASQEELYGYLSKRTDLDGAARQIIWDTVGGGWKTSYADYAKKHK